MEKIIAILYEQTPIMLFILALMMIAVIIDLITGVRKARQHGEATTSEGFRKTCKKLTQYIVPLLAFFVFDWMLCIMPFYDVPYLSLIYGGFCVLTEAKSIFENTHSKEEKKEIAKSMVELATNVDDKRELLKTIIKEVIEEKEENNGIQDK